MGYPWFPPFTRVEHNIGILTQGKRKFYRVVYAEEMPGGSQSVVDFGAPAASATIAAAVQNLLQLEDGRLLEVKFCCLDDIEVRVALPGGTPKFFSTNWSARITPWSGPSPKIYILGADRDAQFEVFNPRETALATARAVFWGHGFYLDPLEGRPSGPIDLVEAQGYGGMA